jgi:hypothetical protein
MQIGPKESFRLLEKAKAGENLTEKQQEKVNLLLDDFRANIKAQLESTEKEIDNAGREIPESRREELRQAVEKEKEIEYDWDGNPIEKQPAAEITPSGQLRHELQSPIKTELFQDKGELFKTPQELDNQRQSDIKKMGKLSSEIGQANIPGVEEAAALTKEAIHILSPRSFVPKPALDEIMRMKGGQDRAIFELETQLHKVTESMDKWPKEKQVSFIDNIKLGKQQETPALQNLSEMMRTVEDNYWKEAKQYKDSLAYKENHYRVLWKVIPGSPEAKAKGFKGLFRRPLQGTKGFLKQSTLESMSEGIAMGGEPYTYNPMKMWQDGIIDMQKFITAQRMFRQMKDMDYAKFVKSGGDIPEGFVALNDNISKVYFPTEQGMVKTGEYYIEENVGRILNNFLSKDLIRSSKLGSSLLALKNITTSMELSLSPFHAAYVSLATTSSGIGLGIQKIVNQKDFVGGLKDILLSGIAPVEYAKTGGRAIKFVGQDEFINTPEGKDFIKEYPDAKQLIEDLFTGGGKLAIHQDYKINAIRSFQEGIKNKEPWAVAWNALPAGNQLIMRPLFETYIPRLKIGTFLKEYSFELKQREQELVNGTLTRPELSRRVWDNVENRLGEMNFDNLFWDRTFKSGLQLAFRSVTWKIGALKNIGQALPEQILEFKKAYDQNRAPLLTGNMGWLMGVGALASVFSYVTMGMTGQGQPKDVKDLIAPRFDKSGNRVSLNTHIKDWVHIWHNPLGFISNSLSGEIGRILNVWNNKDFYGVEVYGQDDAKWKQAMDIATQLAPIPFSISSQKNLKSENAPTALKVTTALGITQPSPGYISNTPAIEEAHKINKDKLPLGSRTKKQFDKQQLKKKLSEEYKNNSDKSNINAAVVNNEISRKDATSIIKNSKLSQIEYLTKNMTYDEIVKVMEKANPDEIKELIPIFDKKVRNKINVSSSSEAMELRKLKETVFNNFSK